VAEASQCATQLRNVYRAAVIRENPKHAIMIIRELHSRLDQTAAQLTHFRTGLLALTQEIETQIPPDASSA
jgi:hypothetical protein